jgi:hypothetical protein
MRAIQQLDRIVIDECHMVLNEQMNFRKQMQQLGEVGAWHDQPRPRSAPVTSSDWLKMQSHRRNGRLSLLGRFHPAHMIFRVVAVVHTAISSPSADF